MGARHLRHGGAALAPREPAPLGTGGGPGPRRRRDGLGLDLARRCAAAAAGVSILAGFALGFVLQRSRPCIVRAFREPFLTGDARHSYALILALAVGTPIIAALVKAPGVDVSPAIPATFWAGSLAGGIVFGMGMVWAGGCGAGALWRAGEGHLKLWVALVFFSWSRSIAGSLLRAAGAFTPSATGASPLGYPAYLPDMFGWHGAYLLTFALLLAWFLLVRRNAATHRLALAP
jgi:hypothetical protein